MASSLLTFALRLGERAVDMFYTLSLNPALTIDANNDNKTVTSVRDELEAKLTAGYE